MSRESMSRPQRTRETSIPKAIGESKALTERGLKMLNGQRTCYNLPKVKKAH